jgi:MFS family permease
MASQDVTPGAGQPPAPVSAWAPFRQHWFAAMWSAQFVSNIGSWMQTVGAQWLMLMLTGSATYVALVQTASSLPVVVFAVLAGAAGDLVDRRHLLLVSQTLMLLAAAALGALALAGLVTPWVLLALVFAVGTGSALTAPTWQVLQPELVPPDERQQAISFGSVNQNLARAVGPAIGGIVLAATSSGTVFLINAASFLVVIAVIWRWRSSRRTQTLPREHVGEAIRAGGRYVAASPVLRVILLRAFLFIFFAASIWALLPLVAQRQLHLGSGGYGVLLGSVGVGAVAGAGVLPRLRTRLTPGGMLTAGSLGLAVVALILGYVHITAVVAVALAVGGLAWILALSTLNSLYQLTLPGGSRPAACRSTWSCSRAATRWAVPCSASPPSTWGSRRRCSSRRWRWRSARWPGCATGSSRFRPRICFRPGTGRPRSSRATTSPPGRCWSPWTTGRRTGSRASC